MYNIKLFAGSSCMQLSKSIASNLNVKLSDAVVSCFSDHETQVEISESVRGQDVYIVQSTSTPANEHFMELLIMVDAVKRAGAHKIITIIPYFGYARQDRKLEFKRTPISAALCAKLLTTAGVDTVITMDLHAQQIQGFFNGTQIINTTATPLFLADIHNKYISSDIVVVSPDVGGVGRARNVAKQIHNNEVTDLAIIDKRRPSANESVVMNVIGDVEGKVCIMIDDMVDTAGTLCNAARALIDRGASKVVSYCTHGVLSDEALNRIHDSPLTELVITDTIPHVGLGRGVSSTTIDTSKIRVLNTGPTFAETVRRLRANDSVSQQYYSKGY